MRLPDKKLKSVSDLLKKLTKDTGVSNQPVWFRGHSKASYELIPSYHRLKKPLTEEALKSRFKQSATILLESTSRTDFEWLLIMQHHGVPTRILDWTESPLTALYFACISNPKKDGILWMLMPVELNNFSSLKTPDRYGIPDLDSEILKNYTPETLRLESVSSSAPSLKPAAVLCGRNTSRMQAQLGTFVVFQRDKTPIEKIENGNFVWRYNIPAAQKMTILKELKLIGITKFHLFPELSSVGESITGES